MDVSKYRKETTEELKAAAERAPSKEARAKSAETGTLERADASEAERLETVRALGRQVTSEPENIDRLIAVLADRSQPASVRIAALDGLQAATFLVQTFAPKRPEYLETLRSIIEDPDRTLRRRAIGVLAREKDEYVQRRLIEGLEHPSKALVSPAKAIQYLGYDVHAEYFPLLRRLVENPPTLSAQEEAIRILAADPKSRTLLTRILTDREQPSRARYMSAVSLQSLAPEKFQNVARTIALDDDEDDRLRVASLTALTHYAKPETTPKQATFTRQVEKLEEGSSSSEVKRASKTYVARARR
jgi:hypothetical protein